MIVKRKCDPDDGIYQISTSRIGTSLTEFTFLILYGMLVENGERQPFLLYRQHGLYIFIATCIFFFIHTQYMVLFPEFALPLDVNIRSKWGYAFGNELSELKKIKVRVGYQKGKYIVSTPAQFWDEPVPRYPGYLQPTTAAIFALANGNYDIVQWLEEQGAV
eukprot:145084_1